MLNIYIWESLESERERERCLDLDEGVGGMRDDEEEDYTCEIAQ
jgi:hypothetical protein